MRRFIESEAAGGMVLIGAAALALVLANGRFAEAYDRLLLFRAGPMDLHHWINDALMALFFLLVGLEIKREFLDGRLSSWSARRLPLIAAASGMVVPAALYLAVVRAAPPLYPGWAIPAATDIAFALAVLALLGSRAPASLRLFLVTVAIADDLGAVAIIAIAYTAALDLGALAAAAALLLAMAAMGRFGVRRLWPYLIAAVMLWYAVLVSGVHPTVAGVLAAAAIPRGALLERLEHGLSRWVAFLVLPLFGLANAGVSLAGIDVGPVAIGAAAGLFLGKQIGIFGAVRLSVRAGTAPPLQGASWRQVYGVAILTGIGFTMSLFIAALAFPADPALLEQAKIGVLAGSLASAVTGYLVLRFAPASGNTSPDVRSDLGRDCASD